eukprot:4504193-Prymnesium_polylepis.1
MRLRRYCAVHTARDTGHESAPIPNINPWRDRKQSYAAALAAEGVLHTLGTPARPLPLKRSCESGRGVV